MRHACALIRGQSSPENSRGGTEKAAISEFMKLSAISYVLRKSLGVRSFAKSELLPMRGKHWGWSFWKGYTGGGLVETLASDLVRKRRKAVLKRGWGTPAHSPPPRRVHFSMLFGGSCILSDGPSYCHCASVEGCSDMRSGAIALRRISVTPFLQLLTTSWA